MLDLSRRKKTENPCARVIAVLAPSASHAHKVVEGARWTDTIAEVLRLQCTLDSKGKHHWLLYHISSPHTQECNTRVIKSRILQL